MIYATLLPTGFVKIGRDSWFPNRTSMAQMYFVEEVKLIGAWPSTDEKRDEWKAHTACGRFHVTRELFRGEPADILAALEAVLGPAQHPIITRGSGQIRAQAGTWTEERRAYQRAANLRHRLRQKCDLI